MNTQDKGAQKPPLGVMPQKLWKEFNPQPTIEDAQKRIIAVNAAIGRYNAESKPYPPEWETEISQLQREHNL